jgi:hypothetical protein
MRKLLLTLMLISGLIPISNIFGQSLHFPTWIKGTWQNSYESNSKNIVFWTFYNDSIYLSKGLFGSKSDRENFNNKYKGYTTNEESNDSLYRIHFSKVNESIIYEFKFQKVDYSEKPVMTYSLTINGIIKREHYTSCNLVFLK